MQSDYSEQDTERARAAERSSAGQRTQQFGGLPPAALAPQAASGRNNLPALALIAVGALMLFGRVVPGRGEFMGGAVILTIASCFLFFAFWRRIYGLLIPGCILAGLSLGIPFASLTDGVSVLWGLALGFLAIQLVGAALFNVRNSWPIYPAVPLFAIGLIVGIANTPWIFAGWLLWLPLLLIGVGLYLGWGRATR